MTTKKATEKTAHPHKVPKAEHEDPVDQTPLKAAAAPIRNVAGTDIAKPVAEAVESQEPTPGRFAKQAEYYRDGVLDGSRPGWPGSASADAQQQPIPAGPDGYEEIRRVYNVPATVGMRVKVHDREGVLVAPRQPDVVDIWFDGDDHAHVCHPTEGDVVYLDAAKGGI